MTTPPASIARSIYECASWFSTTLADDLQAFFKDLDALMFAWGQSPLRFSMVAMNTSTTLDAHRQWLRTEFGRPYGGLSSSTSLAELTTAYLVEVALCPDFGAEAVVIAARLDLARPLDRNAIWKGWVTWLHHALAQAGPGSSFGVSPQALAPEVLAEYYPEFAGARLVAHVHPLTAMSDEGAIERLVVAPLFEVA